jgi:3-isopropylmalate/(R)-2-methylmalate dehydratase small subunit
MDEVETLFKKTKEDILEISIDLQKRQINLSEKVIHFEVDDHLINRIIFDLDDVDITLKEKNKILKFEKERIKNKPWIYTND